MQFDALIMTPDAEARIAELNGPMKFIAPVADTKGRKVIGADVLTCIGPGEFLEAFHDVVVYLEHEMVDIPEQNNEGQEISYHLDGGI